MRNPFSNEQPIDPAAEHEAAEYFADIADEALSEGASASIRATMMSALVATSRAVGHSGRFAFAGSAVMVPLLAVGAVSAAAGESPISGPVSVIEGAAATLGIGGTESPAPSEGGTVTVLEPGSAPTGQSAAVKKQDEPAPTDGTTGGDTAEDEDSDSDETGASAAATAAHENGKGCDDVLFAEGEPPFASPGGPVGCEVGNSGEHRQNGAKHEDSDTGEDSDAAEEDEEDADGDDDKPGGVSHGLGRGHDEDRPGQGQANGHDKHDHEPNTSGHGPGGPNADDDDGDGSGTGGETPTEPEPTGSTAGGSSQSGPGRSGEHKPENPGKKK